MLDKMDRDFTYLSETVFLILKIEEHGQMGVKMAKKEF